MKYIQIILCVLVLLTVVNCKLGEEIDENGEIIIMTNISLIPMTSNTVQTGKALVIKDGTIEKIINQSAVSRYKGYRLIDGEDKYVIPGMIDMHMHLMDVNDLALNIVNGVTTVRCMGEYLDPGTYPNSWKKDAFFETTLEVKKMVEEGRVTGPRIFTSSYILDGVDPFYGDIHITYPLKTPEEAEKAVIESVEAGYDFIKIYFNLPEEVYDSIIQTARKYDKKVIGHVPFAIPLEKALEDMYTIEHLTGYFDYDTVGSNMERFAPLTRQNNVWHCPTINALKHMLPLDDPIMRKFATREEWKYLKPEIKQNVLELFEKAVEKTDQGPGIAGYYVDYFIYDLMMPLNEAGVDFLVGTDSPVTFAGFGFHEELLMMSQCGLSNYELLKAATYNGAACLGKLDEFGTIEKGKAADLILLDANPLEDIENARKISGVMVKGEWFDRAALDSMLEAAEKRYK